MELKIYYQNTTASKLVGYRKYCHLIGDETLKYLRKKGNYELSLTIVDDLTMQQYNKKYRQIDHPTDVISFAFNDAVENIKYSQEIPNNLGDIIISLETAQRQAKSYGHSMKRELCFLYLHGLLHLLGYDHQTQEQEDIMFELQDIILNKLSITKKGLVSNKCQKN